MRQSQSAAVDETESTYRQLIEGLVLQTPPKKIASIKQIVDGIADRNGWNKY